MTSDLIEILIDEAYQLFNEHSLYEVIDLERDAAQVRMISLYGPALDEEKVEKYFNVLDTLRFYAGGAKSRTPSIKS